MLGSNEELREIQQKELELLKEVKKLCEKHNLTYFLCGGTLLGAVRHHGFIPWDDDIDIMMPREDYVRFIRAASEEWHGNIRVEDYYYGGSPRPDNLTHVVDGTVKIIRENYKEKRVESLCIDLYPLDGMPRTSMGRMIYYYRLRFYYYLFHISCFEYIVDLEKPGRPFCEKFVIAFLKKIPAGRLLDAKKILGRMHSILSRCPYGNSRYIYSCFGRYKKEEMLPRVWFEKISFLEFEDVFFPVPAMYHEVLEHYYGDYMVMPDDVSEKELHHPYKVVKEL